MNTHEKAILLQQEKELQDRREHQITLMAVASLLQTKEGKQLFKYLFKNMEVMTTPPLGMSGMDLHEYLGFLRAGNSIYKLACEANSEEAALILAKLERDRYAELYAQYREELGLDTEE